jgi:hypothetical protein
MDLFIHENFFALPWQVAFVYDPLGGDQGMFIWRNGKPVREPFLIEEDAMPEPRLTPPAPDTAAVLGRLQSLERRQRWLAAGVLLAGALALGWPVAWSALEPYWRPVLHQPSPEPDATPEPSPTPQQTPPK